MSPEAQPYSESLAVDAIDACNEAWNAFENGKRKHHRDAITGKCILGCQACAIEKLRIVLSRAKMEKACTPGIVEHYEREVADGALAESKEWCKRAAHEYSVAQEYLEMLKILLRSMQQWRTNWNVQQRFSTKDIDHCIEQVQFKLKDSQCPPHPH